MAVQFRREFLELTDTPVFGASSTRFGTGAFGVIGHQDNTPWQIRFALRLTF